MEGDGTLKSARMRPVRSIPTVGRRQRRGTESVVVKCSQRSVFTT
jgi:hypothetical protein